MPVRLHYICKHGDKWRQIGNGEIETGNWTASDETANDAVQIYLHEHRDRPAWHGGNIVRWTPTDAPDGQGKKKFVYTVDPNFRTVRCRDGWGQERAIIHL